MATRGYKNISIFILLFSVGSFRSLKTDMYADIDALMPRTCHTLAEKGSVLKPPISSLCEGVMTFKKETKCPVPHINHAKRNKKKIPQANQIYRNQNLQTRPVNMYVLEKNVGRFYFHG